QIEELGKVLSPKGIALAALGQNPVDAVWARERPAPPAGEVVPHPERYAGTAAEQKIADLQASMRKAGEDWVVLTLPAPIARPTPCRARRPNPGPLAFALVPATGTPELYTDPAKTGPEARAPLAKLVKLVPDDKSARAKFAAMSPAAQSKAAITAERAVRKAL